MWKIKPRFMKGRVLPLFHLSLRIESREPYEIRRRDARPPYTCVYIYNNIVRVLRPNHGGTGLPIFVLGPFVLCAYIYTSHIYVYRILYLLRFRAEEMMTDYRTTTTAGRTMTGDHRRRSKTGRLPGDSSATWCRRWGVGARGLGTMVAVGSGCFDCVL